MHVHVDHHHLGEGGEGERERETEREKEGKDYHYISLGHLQAPPLHHPLVHGGGRHGNHDTNNYLFFIIFLVLHRVDPVPLPVAHPLLIDGGKGEGGEVGGVGHVPPLPSLQRLRSTRERNRHRLLFPWQPRSKMADI